MARPREVDLTGQVFGSLTVTGAVEGPGHKWSCVCECGATGVEFRTEALRWHGKMDCGCKIHRTKHTIGKPMPKSVYRVHPKYRELVPETFRDVLGDPRERRCQLCGISPARNLMPGYGIYDFRFRLVVNDVFGWITTCDICYEYCKAQQCIKTHRFTPEDWFALLRRIANGTGKEPDYRGLLDVGRFMRTHQSTDEAQSIIGMECLSVLNNLERACQTNKA